MIGISGLENHFIAPLLSGSHASLVLIYPPELLVYAILPSSIKKVHLGTQMVNKHSNRI
jgi:hypothetical protein